MFAYQSDRCGVPVAAGGRLVDEQLDAALRRQRLVHLVDGGHQFRLRRFEHDYSYRLGELSISNQRDAKVRVRLPPMRFTQDDYIRSGICGDQ